MKKNKLVFLENFFEEEISIEDFEASLDTKSIKKFSTLSDALEYERENDCFCIFYSYSDNVYCVVE